MSEEAATSGAPPEGAQVADLVPSNPDRLAAALKAGKAAAASYTDSGSKPAPVDPTAPTDPAPPNVEEPEAKPEVPPAKDEALALELRIKAREQRIRESAAAKYAEREQALNRREQEMYAQQQRYANLERMAKESPAKLFNELGFQEKDYIKARLEDGKPEAQISALQRQFEEERQARVALEQSIQNQRAEADRYKQEASFRTMALDPKAYPTVATVYEGADRELVQEAYRVQAMFVEQHRRQPDLEEICINLENIEKKKAERYAKLNGTKAPAEAPKSAKAPKAIPGDVAGRDTGRTLTYEEKKQRALMAGKKAFANYK